MNDVVDLLRQAALTNEDYRWKAADELEALRAENTSLAAWQCVYTDGKTGLVGDEHGNQYCAMAREVEAVRSANRDVMLHFDVLKADYDALRAEVERLRAALGDVHAAAGTNHLAARIARAALSGADAPPKKEDTNG